MADHDVVDEFCVQARTHAVAEIDRRSHGGPDVDEWAAILSCAPGVTRSLIRQKVWDPSTVRWVIERLGLKLSVEVQG